jgi:hypothetical protein
MSRFDNLRNAAAAANAVKLSYEPILPAVFGEGSEAYSNVGAEGYPASHTIFAVYGGMGPFLETKFGPASFPQLTDMETGAQLQVPGHTSLVKQLTDYYCVGDELAITCFGPTRDESGKPRKSQKGAAPILWRATAISALEGAQAQAEAVSQGAALEEVNFEELPSMAAPLPEAEPVRRTGTKK